MQRSSRRTAILFASLAVLGAAAQAQAISGQGTWESTLQARDINGDSVTDAYFDTALNMTWLADANVAGRMTWSNAVSWAASLDVYGVTGWSLPVTNIAGQGNCDYGQGGTECGYRPTPNSPMTYMYYVTLGNQGYPSASAGLANAGPFLNLQPRGYWSSTATPNPTPAAWDFYFGEGALNYVRSDNDLYAWATHQGDVPVSAVSPVPEPSTYALMLAGLGAVAALRRRREPAAEALGLGPVNAA